MAGLTIKLSEKSQDAIKIYFQGTQSSVGIFSDRNARMEAVDQKFSMEQSKRAKEKNIKGKLDPVVTPTVLTHCETAVAQLAEIFLTGQPIFSPVSSPKYINEMTAMQGSFAAQQRQFAWDRNLLLFFKDAVKYNVGALEVTWDSYAVSTVGSDDQGAAKIKVEDITGNRIKRLDPYNTFYDTSVAIADVHTEGAYAGYTEKVSRMKLHMVLDRLGPNVINRAVALKSQANGVVRYYRPAVVDNSAFQDDDSWTSFFGLREEGAETEENKGTYFYLTTLYSRIIPKEFGIDIPTKDKVTIFKFVIVNGCHVVFSEALTDSHQYLPILLNEPTEDGLRQQTKSYAERLIPIQNLSSDLHTARVVSLRRATGDRALYDPTKIAAKDVNSPNPAAKIPVRNIAYGTNINAAYYQIPYVDQMAQYLLSEAAQVDRYGQNVTGQNPTSQGNFIPGNKTQMEFSTIMSNANNRTLVLGMFMESQTFVPLKSILLFNTLQYQQSTLFVDIEQQEPVNYNPIDIRQVNWDFEVADGLLPVSKIANPQVYAQAFQTIATLPQLSAEYKVGDMLAYMLALQGIKHLKQFKKTPEEIQAEQVQAMQLRVAENGANQAQSAAAQQGQQNGQSTAQ